MDQETATPLENKDTDSPTVSALILAAGKGTRMKSGLPKVLHPVCFKPMIHHVLDAVTSIEFDKIVLVTGHQAEAVEASCSRYPLSYVRQKEQLGTGHAVLAAEPRLAEVGGVVMILCGDTPLISSQSLRLMIYEHLSAGRILTVASTVLDDPTNYGRLEIDSDNTVRSIVEEKEADRKQKKIKTINTGIYCVDSDFLFRSLKQVGSDNNQGEVYLTDIVSLANQEGYAVHHFPYPDSGEVLGVNSRIELAQAHAYLQAACLEALMENGVTIYLPETVTVDPSSHVGEDTIIKPNVYICGKTRIGRDCRIDPFVYIADCLIGDNVRIGAGAYLKGVTVEAGEVIEPGGHHAG